MRRTIPIVGALALVAVSALLDRIKVPVPMIFGDEDAIFSPDAAKPQASGYTGSPDVTLEMIPKTSRFPILEATLPTTVAAVDKWLSRQG
jgi:pimeloyl-ACP methyl ester carboxylesterase